MLIQHCFGSMSSYRAGAIKGTDLDDSCDGEQLQGSCRVPNEEQAGIAAAIMRVLLGLTPDDPDIDLEMREYLIYMYASSPIGGVRSLAHIQEETRVSYFFQVRAIVSIHVC